MRKRADRANLVVLGDLCQTSQTVLAVDVHGARTANTLTARSTITHTEHVLPSKHKSGVLLVLDLEQSVQHHGSTTTSQNFVRPRTRSGRQRTSHNEACCLSHYRNGRRRKSCNSSINKNERLRQQDDSPWH